MTSTTDKIVALVQGIRAKREPGESARFTPTAAQARAAAQAADIYRDGLRDGALMFANQLLGHVDDPDLFLTIYHGPMPDELREWATAARDRIEATK